MNYDISINFESYCVSLNLDIDYELENEYSYSDLLDIYNKVDDLNFKKIYYIIVGSLDKFMFVEFYKTREEKNVN
nr:MAG TPA: hypothetical protein [Caudoviricetes sp.]